jgi:hypothetical protein
MWLGSSSCVWASLAGCAEHVNEFNSWSVSCVAKSLSLKGLIILHEVWLCTVKVQDYDQQQV